MRVTGELTYITIYKEILKVIRQVSIDLHPVGAARMELRQAY